MNFLHVVWTHAGKFFEDLLKNSGMIKGKILQSFFASWKILEVFHCAFIKAILRLHRNSQKPHSTKVTQKGPYEIIFTENIKKPKFVLKSIFRYCIGKHFLNKGEP